MKHLIDTYNTVHNQAYQAMTKYVVSKMFRLRQLDSNHNDAIELSFLFDVCQNIIRRYCLSNVKPENLNLLINKVALTSMPEEINPVSKFKKQDYNLWFQKKSLCTWYENWERLAYIVCEIYHADVEITPIICDLLIDISSMEIQCITEIVDTYAKKIDCDTTVDLTYDEIKCNNDYTVEALVQNCAVKYNLDSNLVRQIICEVYPNISAIDLSCDNISNLKVFEVDENNIQECN